MWEGLMGFSENPFCLLENFQNSKILSGKNQASGQIQEICPGF
jgi:hypothetical protein